MKSQLKQVLNQLNTFERKQLSQISSQLKEPLSEGSLDSIAQGIGNISKNWKSWSRPMLMSLLLTPNISNALHTHAPDVYSSIQKSLTHKDKDSTRTIKTVNFTQSFGSGKSTISNPEEVKKLLQDLQNWSKGKNLKHYKVLITAGESQVPNPKGFERGSLAKARSSVIYDLVSKLGFPNVSSQFQIGQTPYKKGDNPQDDKFTQEQFVKLEITVESEDVCSMSSLQGTQGEQGTQANGYVTTSKILSGKGTISINTGTIPDRLVVKNDSGAITQDLGYVTSQPSRYKDWKYVPLYVAKLTELSSTEAVKGQGIKTIHATTEQELLKQLLQNPSATKFQTLGNEIKPGLDMLRKQLQSGVTDFVVYEFVPGASKINFDESKGDFELVVYSPLGDTNYSINAQCGK